MSSNIETVLQEKRVFPPAPAFVKQANISGMDAYRKLVAEAERDFEGFWARLARENLLWSKPFTKVLDESKAPFFRWFYDGELNASYNCLDRHLKTQPDKIAIIFEADDGKVTKITYKQLYHEVCRFANALKAKGIKKADRVLIYMPMSIQAVVAMQACARIAATHSVVFGGFSAKSVQERIIDAGAVAVITADGQFRGGKEIPLKPVVDEALGMGGCEAIKNVIVYKRSGSKVPMQAGRDTWWDDAVKGQADTCEPTFVNAEHPLFILYTSGSTGKPKGIQHSTARLSAVVRAHHEMGVRQQAERHLLVHRRRRLGDRAQLHRVRPARRGRNRGGVRRRSGLSGRGAVLEDHPGSQGQRVLHRADRDPLADQGGRRPAEEVRPVVSLRILGTVGEPINPEAWMWYHETVGGGRCPIVDTWWQTETGGHLISPLPGAIPTKPGSATLPLPGIFADIVDETGHPVGRGKGGILVIKRPWPSMLRTIWGDPERYKKTYWPDDFKGKLYLAGDGASTDEEGYFRIVGRIDDVLNVSGHRLGTMEIESALVANTKLVAEAAVVGRPDELTGEAVCAFVVLKGPRPSGEEALKIAKELRDWVGKEIGAIAKPKDIRFGDNLPKTRSGKIMRRLLRSIAKGEEIKQDVSTLENPAILEQLKQST